MVARPSPHGLLSSGRQSALLNPEIGDTEKRLIIAQDGVEMRGMMISVVHFYSDAAQACDAWHGSPKGSLVLITETLTWRTRSA